MFKNQHCGVVLFIFVIAQTAEFLLDDWSPVATDSRAFGGSTQWCLKEPIKKVALCVTYEPTKWLIQLTIHT